MPSGKRVRPLPPCVNLSFYLGYLRKGCDPVGQGGTPQPRLS